MESEYGCKGNGMRKTQLCLFYQKSSHASPRTHTASTETESKSKRPCSCYRRRRLAACIGMEEDDALVSTQQVFGVQRVDESIWLAASFDMDACTCRFGIADRFCCTSTNYTTSMLFPINSSLAILACYRLMHRAAPFTSFVRKLGSRAARPRT